jgi:murein DD-endopeptidase MepM/ murein hydrolase activator NlpD
VEDIRALQGIYATVAVLTASAATLTVAHAQPGIEVAMVARAIQPGEVVRVEVTCACGEVGPRARAFGLDVPLALSSDGARWQGLVGLDVEVVPGVYALVVDVPHQQDALTRETSLRVHPKQFSTRVLRVSPEFVDPPADLLDRARREASLLERLFKTITRRAWDRPFGLPLTSPPTRNFGSRSVFNAQPRNPHAGIDFNSPIGMVVTAPAAGSVVLATDLFFTGNTIIVDHGAGLYSLLAHLSSMTVALGDVVHRGTKLGHVGATGRATGPHLHWGVRLNGARVDPLSLMVATEDRSKPRAVK